MPASGRLFSKRTLVWLVVVASLSLLSGLFWAVFGGTIGPRESFQADSFSRSAIGHEAFVRLLDELGIPVVQSRWGSGAKAKDRALLMMIEPRITEDRFSDEDSFTRALWSARRVLLVLPKWTGIESQDKAGWVRDAELVNPLEIEALLDLFRVRRAEVVRTRIDRWGGEMSLKPAFDGDVQVLERPEGVNRILYSGDYVLFGRRKFRNTEIFILTDPDLLNTMSLGGGDNAALAVEMVDWARGQRETVVVDEAFHGHALEPDIYRALFDFPLVLATLQAILCLGILLWAAMGRFGAPEPARPPLETGKGFLVRNIASLLRYGGHADHSLQRYLQRAEREAGQRLHLPSELDEEGARQWLERLGSERSVSIRLRELAAEVEGTRRGDSPRVVATARRIHQWKEEMVHGPQGRA